MKRESKFFPSRLQAKTFRLVVILLLAAAVSFAIFITLKPVALWEGIVSTTPPSTQPATKRFTTLPPGTVLPSETECASRVRRSSWETRPDNYTANQRVPTATQIASLQPWLTSSLGIEVNPKADNLRKQITGNFTGTTDELLQWVACKWGIDEDVVRAEAVKESYWHQSQLGDATDNRNLCPPGTGYPGAWNGTECYQSYGILQIKYIYNKSAWPMSRDDTAFSAEYMYGIIRTCYEGWATYLNRRPPLSGYPSYHAGDIWGCIGRWFSGNWYDRGAVDYINDIKTRLTNKEWLQPRFKLSKGAS